MNKQVMELVELVARQCREIACFLESLEWEDLDEQDKEMFRNDARKILSHPDLALIDRKKPFTCGYAQMTAARYSQDATCPLFVDGYIIPLAEALKEVENGSNFKR